MIPSFDHYRLEAWLSDDGKTFNVSAHYGTEQPLRERIIYSIPADHPDARDAVAGFAAIGRLQLGVGEGGWYSQYGDIADTGEFAPLGRDEDGHIRIGDRAFVESSA